ncbi:YqaA family protein [Agrobacterium rosae]|uniref:YqaA family protein n=1 Tax=Agrobacterium rosae TaxID=1972867 RepID=A0AAE5RWJ4_9HYPH|nr:YqaA family protein [Agrobacterium rosae]KAA3510070.1 DedA family protein [Agrobacterium rosae]KAA3514985.1 DedA family protein [Agrobacterium rosae]MCM2433340.1 DedA family protein [Agrobacterium rosae]MDX8331990.1 YqaA family protein [Agrobacterium rosae]MQB50688.1 DedA family protein [Agrobacterium rosae]
MLKGLYAWTMALAAKKTAVWWLAIVAFVESSIFVVPADVLFIPMVLAKPKRAMFYALVATIASVLGGIAGWYLGHYAFESVARPILEFYGKLDSFEHMRASVDYNTILLLLITSGIAHLPPIKVVTILSGAANISLGLFILSAIVTRAARFFILAGLLQRYGEPIRHFIEKRLGLIAAVMAAALIAVYATYVLVR